MCRWCRIDTDRTGLDPIGAIDIECAIGADNRSRKLTVAAADRQIAFLVRHCQTRAIA